MADSFFRWPVTLEQSKKSPLQRIRQWLLFILPVLFFLTAVYLIFRKVQKPPLAQIEEHLSRHEFQQALELAQQELENKGHNRLRYLMLATVAATALPENTAAEYENQLLSADQSGIYLKESYLKRFEVINELPDFPAMLLSYSRNFSLQQTDGEIRRLTERHVDSDVAWRPLGSAEGHEFFQLMTSFFPERVMVVIGDNLQLRQQPSVEAASITKLRAGDRVLRRARGQEIVISGRRANWFYVYTEDQLSGWVFGGYLK